MIKDTDVVVLMADFIFHNMSFLMKPYFLLPILLDLVPLISLP